MEPVKEVMSHSQLPRQNQKKRMKQLEINRWKHREANIGLGQERILTRQRHNSTLVFFINVVVITRKISGQLSVMKR